MAGTRIVHGVKSDWIDQILTTEGYETMTHDPYFARLHTASLSRRALAGIAAAGALSLTSVPALGQGSTPSASPSVGGNLTI